MDLIILQRLLAAVAADAAPRVMTKLVCAGIPPSTAAQKKVGITPSWLTQQISVEKCAHRGASAAPNNVPNCHLEKTNMDKTSQHLLFTYHRYRYRTDSKDGKK